jgi:hypothetical protein
MGEVLAELANRPTGEFPNMGILSDEQMYEYLYICLSGKSASLHFCGRGISRPSKPVSCPLQNAFDPAKVKPL